MQVRSPRTAAAAALLLAAASVGLGRPALERLLRSRLESQARRHGLVARVGAVRLGVWPPLALERVRLERPGAWTLGIEQVQLWLRPFGPGLLGRTRLTLGAATLSGRAGLELTAAPTLWEISAVVPRGWRAELLEPTPGLAASWSPARGGHRLELSAEDLRAGRLVAVRHGEVPLLDPGTLSGRALVVRSAGADGFSAWLTGRGVRLAALGSAAPGQPLGFGTPTDVELALQGSWHPANGVLELSRWAAALDGARLDGTLSLAELRADPRLELTLEVRRVDFARLLRTSGLLAPGAVTVGAGDAPGALGSASLSAHARGRLSDAASFTVSQRLDFTPPREIPPELERLRGDFVHEVTLSDGSPRANLVSPESPDFIALQDAPPLFVRALLLAEDAGFYAHRGIDLAELPAALLTNWARGGAFRGASTLTQQLAKNLFLSREKRLGRKLQELSLALLLEATLDKQRILEIYLNVIEWGPDLHGLRPAARHYFDKEPAALTPAEMAFLVALIPGPVKYQTALRNGTPAAGFRSLVDDLLAKLRSSGALSEEQYQAALAEPLRLPPSEPLGRNEPGP